MSKTRDMFLILTLLALLPTLPVLAGGEAAGPDGETVDEKVRRVVVVPVDGEMHVLAGAGAGETAGETGGEEPEVRVLVRRATEDGERRVRSFAWKSEDGELVELEGEPGEMLFVPGAERGYLGVQLTDLTPELRRHFGAREDHGVLVARVVDDSPAFRAGLQVGDVLTHVDGEPVSSAFEVTTRLGARQAGDVAALEVVRDGKVETLSATLETRERPQIEVGRLLRRLPRGEGFTYEFDPGSLEQQVQEMKRHLESPEWTAKMEEMHEDIRQRLRELDVEIEGLEEEIDVHVRVEKEREEREETDEVDGTEEMGGGGGS